MRFERQLGRTHHLVSKAIGHLGLDTTVLVDADELALLTLGPLRYLVALESELALEQLSLSTHRYVFAGGHRKRPADEAGEPCESHQANCRMRPGEAQDQRHIRDEPVADTEDRGARTTTLEIAVMMIVSLKIDSRGMPTRTDGAS